MNDAAGWTLRLRNVSVARSGRGVLHDLDLEIRAGECVSIIGPNGAGKSTLLLCLLGLLPPHNGLIALNERPLGDLAARERGRFAAYVPQMLEHVPALPVRDVIAAGRYPYSRGLHALSAQDEQAIAGAVASCGLSALAERSLAELSGGERQKALLAAALAQDAQLLCLDEPTTALDPAYQIELVRLLRAWRARGRALVVVSHDLQLAAALGGRVVALRDGRIVADGTGAAILSEPSLHDVFDAALRVIETEDGERLIVPRWNG